jgi:hypothetical protein
MRSKPPESKPIAKQAHRPTRRPRWWILNKDNTTHSAGLLEWISWYWRANTDLAASHFDQAKCVVQVSTEFTGIDEATTGPPMLFKTSVLGGPDSGRIYTWSTWELAMKGHSTIVAMLKGECGR